MSAAVAEAPQRPCLCPGRGGTAGAGSAGGGTRKNPLILELKHPGHLLVRADDRCLRSGRRARASARDLRPPSLRTSREE